MKKNILITGSNGFIGSHLTEKLLEQDHEVFCMVRKSSDTSYLKGLNVNYVYSDLTSPETLPEAVEGIDEIYHLGGTVRVVNKKQYYEINSKGTGNLIEAVKKYNPELKKFVYLSSQAAAGPGGKGPVSDYGKSKKLAEKKVREIKRYAILRPVAVYGPRDRDFLALFKMAQRGVFLKPANSGRLSFIHVKNCVEKIISSFCGEEKYLSDGEVYYWEDVAKVLRKVINRDISVVNLPVFLIKIIGTLGTAAGKVTRRPVTLNSDKVREMVADWAVEINGNNNYSLYEGFSDTYRWYKKHGWLTSRVQQK
ncbi:MAG: NAD-dependent epimerase/dehydratase family protein [Elusimicrobia bacterium]|jgi:nucleoside-diphosphate-sugar epimerase|nr:NAD-dependent epimerase/dehydratase family protein [Elusimicrobiota bacterium]